MKNENIINNILPYNSSDVDIRQQTFMIYQIVKMISDEKIDLFEKDKTPLFKTSWNIINKSRLIESILMGIPVPVFYFDGSNSTWKVIDGINRLYSIFTFIENENSFKLKGLEYLSDLEGYSYNDLPFKYKRMIQDSTILAYIINPGTPEIVKLNIFKRFNTSGKPISRQEIRDIFYRDEISGILIYKLAKFILKLTKIEIDKIKLREAITRYIAILEYKDDFSTTKEEYLDSVMESLNSLSSNDINNIELHFKETFLNCYNLFGDEFFYKKNSRSNINIPLFESFMLNISKLQNSDIEILRNQKDILIRNFTLLISDNDSSKILNRNSFTEKNIEIRTSIIKQLINDIINAY